MEDTLLVKGGRALGGSVRIPAAKNSVLPLLAASLLCGDAVTLRQVPGLSDVDACLGIMRSLGRQAQRCGNDVVVQPGPLSSGELPQVLVEKMRASVLFFAPVLARAGWCVSGLPGGCRLGPRPIDLHLDGLARMGTRVSRQGERLCLSAPDGLRGADITLRFASVGATETLLLAAATARGTTVLRGAAQEPEIVDLAGFLSRCGARVEGAGSPVITVRGVRQLSGADYTPIPDRIVAVTMACAAASAGGQVRLLNCDPAVFAPTLDALRRAGCGVEAEENAVTLAREGPLQGIGAVRTGVYPGLATDAAPLLAAALLTARGPSRIQDTVFPKRFACAAGFAAMGAQVAVDDSALDIRPCAGLHGAVVSAPDLRGGAALAVAALAARGRTVIRNAGCIRRGYQDLAGLLRAVGAEIW